MIPIQLTLSNFMSYADRAEPIDFTQFRMACLSGENGHGKSALLDAITWVLWGEARAHVDSLVRSGQSEMRVELEFLVDGVCYVVSRRRSRKANGSTHTDLFVKVETDTLRSQTGQGERNTQEKITRLLRMDYRSFINSAFILQGRTDEFTRQTPTERKRILAEILDLATYDQLEERAREKQRAADAAAALLQREIETLRAGLAKLPGYERELQDAEAARDQARQECKGCQESLDVAKVERAEMDASVQLLQTLQEQWRKAVDRQAGLRTTVEALRKRCQDLQQEVNRRPQIEEKLAKLDAALKEQDRLDAAERQFRECEQVVRKLEDQLKEQRHKLEVQLSQLRGRLRELQSQPQPASVEAKRVELLRTHRPAVELEQELERLREERDGQREQVQLANADLGVMERELAQLEERRKLLESPGAECPLCLQPLGPHDHERLLHEMSQEEKILREQCQERTRERELADASVKAATVKAQGVQKALKEARDTETRLAALDGELERARTATKDAAALQTAVDGLSAQQRGPLDPALEGTLAEAQQALQATGYQREDHQRCRQLVRSLEPARIDAQKLESAAGNLAESKQRLSEEMQHQSEVAEELERLKPPLDSLQEVQQHVERVEARLKELLAQRTTLEQALNGAMHEVSRCQAQVDQCAGMARALDDRAVSLAAANKEAAVYKDLVAAFGKKGIQAMIIENAVPEIEQEANRLLSLMTDNGMALQFMTQKELKKGGGAETLEIIIGDQAGDRPYECYSGGEAFRINFAIRIALSRLLARRAGAQLQTIVIDEGFGTQDAQGRRRLLDAIHSVKDEFERILVITHLDDLKEEFPVRLHVIKDEDGSRVVRLN